MVNEPTELFIHSSKKEEKPELKDQILNELSLALALSERTTYSKNIPAKIIRATPIVIDLPGRQGFLPKPEEKRLVESALGDESSTKPPIRYSEQETTFEEEVQGLREEVAHGIPQAQLIVYLEASMEELLSAEKRQIVLDRAKEIIGIYPQALQEPIVKEAGAMALHVIAKVSHLGGVELVDIYKPKASGKEFLKTDDDDASNTLAVLPQRYEAALGGVLTHKPKDESDIVFQSIGQDSKSIGNKVDISRRSRTQNYFPATVMVDVGPKDVKISHMKGQVLNNLPHK